MAEQQSISSAVYGLQGTLRDLQQKLPCLVDKTAVERQPNELHALGTVNLDKVRKEFADHINVIRDVCSQFETEVLGDVMKMGAGADPAFRKHFTHLKEQATLESTVLRIKDTLKHTKEFFENTIREKEECKSKIETQRLEKIAQSMGLVTFIDSSQKSESGLPITTITIGGTIIVIDIDIDDTGNVLRAKVTYVSETLQNDQDDRVDAMFAESLQNRQFDLFKRNLACLARLDQLNVKYSSVDFFSILKHLYYDLKQVYQDELQEHSPIDVLLEGHGVPLQHIHYPGLSIAYWMDFQILLDNQQPTETSFAQAARLLLSFEDSIQTTHYLPKSHTSYLTTQAMEEDHFKRVSETTFQWTRPLEFIKPLGSHPEVKDVPVRWVATLDPPLATSAHVCQQLMTVAGLSNQEFVDVQYSSSCDLSLEEMLVKEDLRKHQWVSQKEDRPDQVYRWASSCPTTARMVSRVPFHHPVQLHSIIQCLRQQHMFNELFMTIFNSTTSQPIPIKSSRTSLSLQDILIASHQDQQWRTEVITADAPNSIHITLSTPPLPNQPFVMIPLSIEIPAECPTKPRVRLSSSVSQQKWNPQIFSQELMSQELARTRHIPRFIHWLYTRMVTADSYLLDRIKRDHASIQEEDEENSSYKMIKMDLD